LVLKKVTLQGIRPQGVQRWYCKDCRRAFTPEHAGTGKYTREVQEQAAMLYFDQGASYRAVARGLLRMGISNIDAKGCWSLVQRLASNCKAPWEISLGFNPRWSGYLAVDGDSIPIASHRQSILLGVDVESLDIPHLILAEHEDAENWLFFFVVLKGTLGYPFKGIVSDGDPAIESVVQLVCPGIPHQLCVKHFGDGLHRYLRYQSSHGRGTWREVQRFEETVRSCLYARNLQEAKQLLEAIRADPGFRRVHLEDGLALLERNFGRLTQHFLHPGLPRTSNVAEGVIRKLDRRLNAMDSFANHQTAWNTIKMLALHTRFRTLTDCRRLHKHRNGLAPLELAGVNIQGLNWIHCGQRTQQRDKGTISSTETTEL
jgi:transposase-like protein